MTPITGQPRCVVPRLPFVVAGAVLVAVAASGCRESLPHADASAPRAAASAGGTPSPATSAPTHVVGALDVVTVLEDEGQPAESVIVYDASSDPDHVLGAPGAYHSRADFADGRLTPGVTPTDQVGEVDTGGSVEVFADATAAADWLSSHKEPHPVPGEHDILSVNVVLRLSPRLTSSEIDEYRTSLQDVTGGHAALANG